MWQEFFRGKRKSEAWRDIAYRLAREFAGQGGIFKPDSTDLQIASMLLAGHTFNEIQEAIKERTRYYQCSWDYIQKVKNKIPQDLKAEFELD